MLCDYLQDDEAALTRPATKVQVDLGLTAYSNAAAHHAARKKQLSKQEKTLAAHAEALKAAEKKAEKQLANLRNQATTAQVIFMKMKGNNTCAYSIWRAKPQCMSNGPTVLLIMHSMGHPGCTTAALMCSKVVLKPDC